MLIALTLIGIFLLVCTLGSALAMFLSYAEEPDRGYGWIQRPDAAPCTPAAPIILRLVPGGKAENAPLPQHMAMEAAAGFRVELIAKAWL